jgi:glutamate mutase epsilon subunit
LGIGRNYTIYTLAKGFVQWMGIFQSNGTKSLAVWYKYTAHKPANPVKIFLGNNEQYSTCAAIAASRVAGC